MSNENNKGNSDKTKGSPIAAKIGTGLTLAWLAYALHLAISDFQSYQAMPLNEKGDFLAGIGGPIALLWIVIGYYLQSHALRMQQDELRNQVEETRRLVEQSAKQSEIMAEEIEWAKSHKHEEAQPRIVMRPLGEEGGQTLVEFINFGATVTDIQFSCERLIANPIKIPLWKHGERFEANIGNAAGIAGNILQTEYVDARGTSQSAKYYITADLTLDHQFVDLIE